MEGQVSFWHPGGILAHSFSYRPWLGRHHEQETRPRGRVRLRGENNNFSLKLELRFCSLSVYLVVIHHHLRISFLVSSSSPVPACCAITALTITIPTPAHPIGGDPVTVPCIGASLGTLELPIDPPKFFAGRQIFSIAVVESGRRLPALSLLDPRLYITTMDCA